MKGIFKRTVALTCALTLAMGVTGCSKNSESDNASTATSSTSKNHVYSQEELYIDGIEDYSYFNKINCAGDRVFLAGTEYINSSDTETGDETGGYDIEGEVAESEEALEESTEVLQEEAITEDASGEESSEAEYSIQEIDEDMDENPEDVQTVFHLASFLKDGTDAINASVTIDSNAYMPYITYDSNGNVYAILDIYENENTYSESYYLIKYDLSLNEIWKVLLFSTSESDDNYYVLDMIYSDDNGVLIHDTKGLELYNSEDGSLVKNVLDPTTCEAINTIVVSSGKTYAFLSDGDGRYIAELDVSASKLGEKVSMGDSASFGYYTVKEGIGYDFYCTDSTGIYGFNVGDTTQTLILNYIDSDIDTYSIDIYAAISETEFLAILYSDLYNSNVLYKLTKVNPEDVVDKKVITLGSYYFDYSLRKHVIQFNKENPDYKIQTVIYSKYDTDSDYNAGLTKFNNDIIAGTAPDIIVISPWMPYESYYSKGLFEDLTDRFESDEELSKNEYLDNILEAFKYNGKMYAITPSFTVNTAFVKKSVYDSVSEWNLDNLNKLLDKYGVAKSDFAGSYERGYLFSNIQSMAGSNFMDWSNHECYYNTDDFKAVLELLKNVPDTFDENYYEIDRSAYYRENKSLVYVSALNNFSAYAYAKQGYLGEDIVISGFPSNNGGMSSINATMRICLNSSSNVKDGAWEFMRYFLSDDYQNSDDFMSGEWPLSMERIETLAQRAMERPYYTDEKGNKVEYDDIFYLGDQELIIQPLTKDETEVVIDFLKSLNNVSFSNDAVTNIISEEAQAFYEGQKTVDEVTDIIQSRVKIYVNENS
ncbi:MAG: extracellular solute-binding protein [Butyrivibrio sp.]|nr:extracellular solute-binding protein [Butyrivibrio sp.]